MNKYQKYIDTLNLTKETAYGKCHETCLEMQKTFPELKLIRGHYFDPIWLDRKHWWLETKDGEIIDPTAIQFPSKGQCLYTPWDESQPEPTGKCPNCGEYTFNNEYVHEECRTAFMASLYA